MPRLRVLRIQFAIRFINVLCAGFAERLRKDRDDIGLSSVLRGLGVPSRILPFILIWSTPPAVSCGCK